jgi:FkbM family methyltransferase
MLPKVKIVSANDSQFVLMENDDIIGRELTTRGQFAHQEIELCRLFLAEQKGVIVLDIGANTGSFTVPIAKTLSSLDGQIFAFEPQRIVFQQLCTNVFINRLDNVNTIHAAVGDNEHILEIPAIDFFKSSNPGGFSTDLEIRQKLKEEYLRGNTSPNQFVQGAIETVQMITIDSLEIRGKISFIKLDVEGNELECLVGARKTLERNCYPPIVYEDWRGKFEWYQEKSVKTENFHKETGYLITQLPGRNKLAHHPLNPIQINLG